MNHSNHALWAACPVCFIWSKSFVFEGKTPAHVLHFNPESFYCSAFFIFFNFALPSFFSSSPPSYSDYSSNGFTYCLAFPPFLFFFLPSSSVFYTFPPVFFYLFWAKDFKISSSSDESLELYFLVGLIYYFFWFFWFFCYFLLSSSEDSIYCFLDLLVCGLTV